jgi:hypothetical protein
MNSMLVAKTAMLIHGKPFRIAFLVLCCIIIAPFALTARKRNFNSHKTSALSAILSFE